MEIKLNTPPVLENPKVEDEVIDEVAAPAVNTLNFLEHNVPEGPFKDKTPCNWEVTTLEGDKIQAVNGTLVFVGTRKELSERMKG
jgi:hypothetical protein